MIGHPARRKRMAVAASLIAAALLTAACAGHQPGPRKPAHPGAAGTSRTRGLAGDPLVLRHGTLLGAYVQPAAYTSRGLINAVLAFERQVGHPVRLVHLYHSWDSTFPSPADRYFVDSGKVLLLTWGGVPDTWAISSGKDDALIRAVAQGIKSLGHPILLEFRHEMDRPNLQSAIHGPTAYIAAWNHIRAIFAAVGATNVGWVWCPTAWGFQSGRAQAFYPGNREVDWVCADVYASSPSQSLRAAAGPFLLWATHTRKPVIIGEFAANGNPARWAHWLRAAGRLAESDPQIKAMAYFDANGKDSQGRPFHYWLGNQPGALSVFARLLAQPYFQPSIQGNP